MNYHIIDRINDKVTIDDTLYILGDVYFGKDLKELKILLGSIRCLRKHLILGNHDHFIQKHQKELLHGNDLFSIKWKDWITVKYPYPEESKNDKPWIKQQIMLDHVANRVWFSSHRGAWHLYGHSHGSLERAHPNDTANTINQFYATKKCIDVGIDNAKFVLGEYEPFSMSELHEIMETRENLFIDHHEKRP